MEPAASFEDRTEHLRIVSADEGLGWKLVNAAFGSRSYTMAQGSPHIAANAAAAAGQQAVRHAEEHGTVRSLSSGHGHGSSSHSHTHSHSHGHGLVHAHSHSSSGPVPALAPPSPHASSHGGLSRTGSLRRTQAPLVNVDDKSLHPPSPHAAHGGLSRTGSLRRGGQPLVNIDETSGFTGGGLLRGGR